MIWIKSLTPTERILAAYWCGGFTGWSMAKLFDGKVGIAIMDVALGAFFVVLNIELMRLRERKNR